MWEGKVVLHRETGEPRIEWVVTLTDGTDTWKVVANESMQAALCACARRGVKTRIVLPARNDSWVVAAASRSYRNKYKQFA